MSRVRRKRHALTLKQRLRKVSNACLPKGAQSPPVAAGWRLPIRVLSPRARTRARTKRVIQGSAVRADNYERVTTAKASVEKIDVRQVERGGSRRTLRVAVLAFAVAASVVAALAVAGASELALHRNSHSTHSTPAFLTRALGAPQPSGSLVRRPSRGMRVTIEDRGFTLTSPAGAFRLQSQDAKGGGSTIRRPGAARSTAIGPEADTAAERG